MNGRKPTKEEIKEIRAIANNNGIKGCKMSLRNVEVGRQTIRIETEVARAFVAELNENGFCIYDYFVGQAIENGVADIFSVYKNLDFVAEVVAEDTQKLETTEAQPEKIVSTDSTESTEAIKNDTAVKATMIMENSFGITVMWHIWLKEVYTEKKGTYACATKTIVIYKERGKRKMKGWSFPGENQIAFASGWQTSNILTEKNKSAFNANEMVSFDNTFKRVIGEMKDIVYLNKD